MSNLTRIVSRITSKECQKFSSAIPPFSPPKFSATTDYRQVTLAAVSQVDELAGTNRALLELDPV
jgi:hypothetical protein